MRQLWDWRAGQPAVMLFQKAFSRDAWPSIQLLPDESLALHVVTNAINVYNPRDFAAGAVLRCQALHRCLQTLPCMCTSLM